MLCDSISNLSDPSVENWKREVLSCMYYELTVLSASYVNTEPRSLECKFYEDDFMFTIEYCVTSQPSVYEEFCSSSENDAIPSNFIPMLNLIKYYRRSILGQFEQLAIICDFENLQEQFYAAGNVLCLNVPDGVSLNLLTSFGKIVAPDSREYFIGPCDGFTRQSSSVGRRDIGNLVKRQMANATTTGVDQFVPNMTLTDGNSTCDSFMRIMSDNITILNCPSCGDGNRTINEDCDDGNTNSTDGCSSNCTIEEGFVCDVPQGQLSVCTMCGDGVREGIETCDDNNTMNGDGCSVVCQIEEGFVCNTSVDPTKCSFCGDGVTELYEECDDNNTMSNDGCNSTCRTEEGYVCDPTVVPTICSFCANGLTELYEQCDDNNTIDDDGCSNCTIDDSYLCDTLVIPSLCTLCGDGVKEGIEECDDGNNDDMDGCDTNCSLVLQEDYMCMENASNTTICEERPDPDILSISKTGEVPDVLILFRDQSQFFIDDLTIEVRRSTLNNVSNCTQL